MPTLRQLDYLVALADSRHFRRAAKRANTTQSTLSLQVKALEERLGATLVLRTRNGVELTPVGREIAVIARRMLRDAQAVRDLARRGPGRTPSLLRAGVPASVGPSLLPLTIPAIRREFQNLKLYIREDLPPALVRALAGGEYDFLILAKPTGDATLTEDVLLEEPLYLAFSADHRLAKLETVTTADIAGTDILALNPAHPLHQMAASLAERHGARLRADYEATSLDALREMVALDLGIALLPALYIETRLENDPMISVRALADHPMKRTIAMVWRSGAPDQQTLKALAAIIRKEIAEFLPGRQVP